MTEAPAGGRKHQTKMVSTTDGLRPRHIFYEHDQTSKTIPFATKIEKGENWPPTPPPCLNTSTTPIVFVPPCADREYDPVYLACLHFADLDDNINDFFECFQMYHAARTSVAMQDSKKREYDMVRDYNQISGDKEDQNVYVKEQTARITSVCVCLF